VQLGRYTVLGRLAVGGMAEVLLGRLDGSSGFERQVVIKRVLPQYASQTEFMKLFQQEARFASFLIHPHIAQDFGVDATGAAYLVMEFVDGASLKKLLSVSASQHVRPDPRLICRVFAQVAEALGAVHAAVDPQTKQPLSLVHRDVSPDNVLLSRQGAVKLADFGIARAMVEVSTTRPDTVRGKLRYMAPEQLLGLELSNAIDVWALGVSLYEALTLRRPFPEENEGATTFGIVNVKFPPLDSLRPELPRELVALVHRCLRAEPTERFPSCHDLALELERLASGGSSTVTTAVIGNWVDRLAPPVEVERLRAIAAPVPTETPAPSPPNPGQEHLELMELASAATPAPPGLTLREEPIELMEQPAPPDPAPLQPDEPAERETSRFPLKWVLLAVGLAVLLGAATFGRKWPTPKPPVRQVLITSSPNGATVRHSGRTLGTTPWAGDLPADLELELTLDAPGYQTKKLRLSPTDVQANATLQRR
jgi:serine/threonine-protein kinase